MMMAARTVYVTVVKLFGGGFAHVHDFHIEVEGNARQRVVGIYGDFVEAHFGDGDYLALVGLKLHAFFYFLIAKSGAGHALGEVVIFYTVSFFGSDGQLKFIAFHFSFETFFHAGNEVADALYIVKGLATLAGVENFS